MRAKFHPPDAGKYRCGFIRKAPGSQPGAFSCFVRGHGADIEPAPLRIAEGKRARTS
jgi:hypothetical protein